VSVPGLPPELAALLARLRQRGLPVTPLEIGRLQHLLAVAGSLEAGGLPALLAAVLCKDEAGRTLLQREYRAWAAEFEPSAAAAEPGAGTGGQRMAAAELFRPDAGAGEGVSRRLPWYRRLGAGLRRHRWRLLGGAVLLALGGLGWWWIATHTPARQPHQPASFEWDRLPPQTLSGSLCPQDLPTQPAPEVWAWVPVADDRPWAALGGGLLSLALLAAAARRLWGAPRRWLPDLDPGPGGDAAPRQGLPPRPVRGDLLLAPAARRELVWSIERYCGEDPDRALDPAATVAATARAAGAPHLVQRRRTFPRQVWLWCDQKTDRPATLARLVLEVRRALDQANLPVRVARFRGLPGRLTWEDSREPFAPGCQEAAGAAAVVAVLTDGAALVQAWEHPGERPRLEPLLRELRAWPRLLLVDLGDGDLTRLAPAWRLPVRGGEGLAAWLAAARPPGGTASEPAPRTPPNPAQLDLWAAAWLLGPQRPDPGEARGEVELLRRDLGLRLAPFDDGHLAARLERCARDPDLAAALVARLARSQARDGHGLPVGDGYLTRALAFWDARLADGLARLPPDDAAGRARIAIDRARLALWRDPEGAAAALAGIGGRRNRALIRAALAGGEPGTRHGPTWDWGRQPVAVRWRLRALGLGGGSKYGLRRGARHHLALALLAGVGLAGLGWGLERLLRPHQGGGGPFGDDAFRERILSVAAPGRTWLGSPWRLTALASLGPLETPHTWDWQSAANPQLLGGRAAVLVGGTRAFPIRACTPDWPRRALAVIAADRDDQGALKLAIRLLDRGTADRVLIAPDWPARLADLTQGVGLPDDQLLVFHGSAGVAPARPQDSSGDVMGAADLLAELIGRFQSLAEVRGDLAALAAALDFPGARPVESAWPGVSTRTLAGKPRVAGGPQVRTDRYGVTWVRVCGGTFLMGSPAAEDANVDLYAQGWVDALGGTLDERRKDVRGWLVWSRPVHPVLVDAFEIARTELTQGQDRAADGPGTGEEALPLAKVSYDDAAQACARLSPGQPAVGWSVGLATEAQWEFAARAGTATPWSFGEDINQLGDYAWFKGNADDRAHPVGEKTPNGLCLADLQGNVYEWVADCFDADTYRVRARAALTIDPFVDQSGCEQRVVRGGSFLFPPGGLRPAGRLDFRPDGRGGGLGLRCVRSRARQP